jgi:hypothetical protein
MISHVFLFDPACMYETLENFGIGRHGVSAEATSEDKTSIELLRRFKRAPSE